jgi:betaine lipid synthase
MGKLCWVLQQLAAWVGLGGAVRRLLAARDLQEQRRVWDSLALVHFGGWSFGAGFRAEEQRERPKQQPACPPPHPPRAPAHPLPPSPTPTHTTVKHGPKLLVWLFGKLLALLLFNRMVLWFGGGVPCKQYKVRV